MQACLARNFSGDITALIAIGETGKQEQVMVLSEGSAAQCIPKETMGRTYPAPSTRFVSKVSVHVTE